MKKHLLKVVLVVFVGLMIFSIPAIGTTAQDHDDDHEDVHDHTENTEDQCTSPTEEITVLALQNEDGTLSYDKEEYQVSKGACVEITIKNSNDILHDFTIEEDHDHNFDGFHVAIANRTAINGTDSYSVHIQFPESDLAYDLWCTVAGHRVAGMEAKIIIGNPPSTVPGLGFDLGIILFGIFSISMIIILRKKV
ncbi:MAG: hypothetical protein HeimC3_33940 [Candidatus Heimdallarchaeota archaeon LC_3]|nr:MAG: hypothetical protein HeimC3_33940 [Candidatus Heimdallarchaeota archaeon LC_3]